MQTAGIYMAALEHAEAIQRLASDAAVAATTRLPHPYPPGGARTFIESRIEARQRGADWCFVIMDRRTVVGMIGLDQIEGETCREFGYWIGREYWGRGYASFAVKMALEFAFRNLRLQKVCAGVLESNSASRRVLEKNGFRLLSIEHHHDPLLKRPDERVAKYELTAADWQASVNQPALASLHSALRAILAAELAAGNEVLETGSGWPDQDSVFVRLRHVFRTRPHPLPAGVRYTERNDPHGWKAEFSSDRPRHILAC